MLKKNIKKIIFIGSKDLGFEVFKSIYAVSNEFEWTLLMPDDSKDARSHNSNFVSFAKKNSIDFFICKNNTEAKKIIKKINPEIGFVCGWYWLIDKSILSIIDYGLWGMHNSLLPKYRGGAPLVWSIINGEKIVGSTIFKIEEGMDDGEILHTIKVELDQKMHIGDVLNIIQEKTVSSLPKKWNLLLHGSIKTVNQNESYATYCSQRMPNDGLIAWSEDASKIYNFIRAQSHPYPGSFTYYKNQKIKIMKAKIVDNIYFGTPGQILRVLNNSVYISCGHNTAIEIISLQLEDQICNPSRVFKSIKIRL